MNEVEAIDKPSLFLWPFWSLKGVQIYCRTNLPHTCYRKRSNSFYNPSQWGCHNSSRLCSPVPCHTGASNHNSWQAHGHMRAEDGRRTLLFHSLVCRSAEDQYKSLPARSSQPECCPEVTPGTESFQMGITMKTSWAHCIIAVQSWVTHCLWQQPAPRQR